MIDEIKDELKVNDNKHIIVLGHNKSLLNYLYKQYSKTIPLIGKFVVGSDKPYKYLIKSIEKFYNQEQLVELILDNGFSNVEFRNVSNGISAIHSGWKI